MHDIVRSDINQAQEVAIRRGNVNFVKKLIELNLMQYDNVRTALSLSLSLLSIIGLFLFPGLLRAKQAYVAVIYTHVTFSFCLPHLISMSVCL